MIGIWPAEQSRLSASGIGVGLWEGSKTPDAAGYSGRYEKQIRHIGRAIARSAGTGPRLAHAPKLFGKQVGTPDAPAAAKISSNRPDRTGGADPGADRGLLGRRHRRLRSLRMGPRLGLNMSRQLSFCPGAERSGRRPPHPEWRLRDLLHRTGSRSYRSAATRGGH